MSYDVDIYGIRPIDDEWKKMKAVYDACDTAGVSIPKTVHKFFNLDEHDEPDPDGVVVRFGVDVIEGDMEADGLCIHLDKIPKDIKLLKVMFI